LLRPKVELQLPRGDRGATRSAIFVRFWLFELVEATGFGVKSQHFWVSKSGAQLQSFFFVNLSDFFFDVWNLFIIDVEPLDPSPILPYFSLLFSRQTSNLQHWQMLPQGGAP